MLQDGAVLLHRGLIESVEHVGRLPPPEGSEIIESEILIPGFIDMHVHGAGGHAFAGGADATREVCRLLARSGVTTCYAGLGAGRTLADICETVAAAATVVGGETGGARLAGVFMEGPFISVEKKGAWNAGHLRQPSLLEMKQLISAAADRIRRINVAPELPGALDLIRNASDQGVVVSIGHSNATYEQALAAVAAGATIVNHTFNAMSGLDHRAPGLVGAAMTSKDLLAELILDGVHVHPAAALSLYRAKGAIGVALVTDGSQMLGLPDGTYQGSQRTVTVREGACRLPDGTLAGSVSPFDRDVRNARQVLDADLVALAALSSGNAARAMGLADQTGAIREGLAADLVLLDDSLELVATVVGGTVVYRRED